MVGMRETFQTSVSCSSILNCADCTATDYCGWCTNAKKCVEANRMGNPKTTCSMKYFATSPTQCAATRPSFVNRQVSSELTGTGAAATVNTKKQPPPLIGGNCPSTDKIVEAANAKLTDTIKANVRSELSRYNIPLVEGFSKASQERDISTLLLAQAGDTVKKMVSKSVEAAGYTAPA